MECLPALKRDRQPMTTLFYSPLMPLQAVLEVPGQDQASSADQPWVPHEVLCEGGSRGLVL